MMTVRCSFSLGLCKANRTRNFRVSRKPECIRNKMLGCLFKYEIAKAS